MNKMSFAGSFWATVELLVALDATTQSHSPFEDDVEDWLENVSSKVQQLKNKPEEDSITEEDSVDYGNLVDCSFSCPAAVRSRLELLMGSNVVRLTDRKYMLKLMSKIRQEHESQQEARIQDRKMCELMRTKKMILNRFIPVQEAPAEIRQYPLFQLYLYCDAIIEQRRRKRVAKKVKISKSLYRLLYPEKMTDEAVIGTTEEVEEDKQEELQEPMKEVVVDGVTEMVPLTREELEAAAKEKELSEDMENGYVFSREEYENLHYEADAVKKLKETRTVDEMYAKAHEIVGLLFSLAGDEKRKRCAGVVRDKEITVSS